MELNFKLTYDIPEELIHALGLTNDTLFSAYICDGKLHIETVDEDDIESEEDEDYSDGYKDGYGDGYNAAINGGDSPEKLFGDDDADDYEETDECESCPYFCHSCGTCTKDWEAEYDE